MKFQFKFAKDFMYSAAGIIIMNAVLQFLVYPQINAVLGEEQFGVVLYLLSIVSLLSGGFGAALNNTRILNEKKFSIKNGDYNFLLIIYSAVSVAFGLFVLYMYDMFDVVNIIMFSAVIVFTLLRCYSDCEYRIKLDFRRYFIFYLLISAGYAIGVLVFNVWSVWYIVFILGELLCFLMVFLRGNIYKKPNFQKSENASLIAKGTTMVVISYLISNFFLNIDRIVLANVMDGNSVTIYYVASLLGKTLALLVVPLNGVILSHLAGYKDNLKTKQFVKLTGLTSGMSAVFFVLCIVISPWLIGLLYPNVYDSAADIIWPASLAQIFYFASNLLLIVVLKFYSEKFQVVVQAVFGIVFVAGAIPATIFCGLIGFTYAALFANALRFILVIIIGLVNSMKGKPAEIPRT